MNLKVVFLATFLSVVVLDVDIGLGLGVLIYIILHLVRSMKYETTFHLKVLHKIFNSLNI
jgi:hypothetical protein